MLTKDEIEEYKRFGNPDMTEKDYLQEIILHEIYSDRKSTRFFVFKGGTALSKFYSSDRFSEDLDFSFAGTEDPIDQIYGILDEIARRLFYDAEFLREPSTNRFSTVSAELGIKGPRYNGRQSSLQHIRLEISTVSKASREPVQLPRNPEYGDIGEYIGTVMDRGEILSEKLRAMTNRRRHHRERDLYDLGFLLGKGVLPDRREILRKFEEAGMQFSGKLLLEAIDSIKPNWSDLAPFVSHELRDYEKEREEVVSRLGTAGIL